MADTYNSSDTAELISVHRHSSLHRRVVQSRPRLDDFGGPYWVIRKPVLPVPGAHLHTGPVTRDKNTAALKTEMSYCPDTAAFLSLIGNRAPGKGTSSGLNCWPAGYFMGKW